MYLKTTKEVTYNDTKTTSKTVLMNGTLEEIYQKVGGGKTKFVYNYTDVDGGIYSHTFYELTSEERDEIYPIIKDSLPNIDEVGEAAYDMAMYYAGFKYKMVEEFPELTIEDIEIIE
tara:strand:+ start:240 stop:590 length:351 start_codon:yes stop_codon:yes gene_type:complete